MFNEMDEIQDTVSDLSEHKWGWIKKELGKKIERWTREGEQDEPVEIYDTESMEDDDEEMSIKLNKVLVIHVKFVSKRSSLLLKLIQLVGQLRNLINAFTFHIL